MKQLRDIPRILSIVRGENVAVRLFLATENGSAFVVGATDTVEFSISETAGSPRLVYRSTDLSNLTVLSIDGLSAVEFSGLTVSEWASIASGYYVGQLQIVSASGRRRISRSIRISIEETSL
jgi:hypothetical protein